MNSQIYNILNNTITSALSNDLFPSIVLLDGNWGSGKTLYVRTELERAINNDNRFGFSCYFSLNGINSVSGFKNRLMYHYFKNSQSHNGSACGGGLIQSIKRLLTSGKVDSIGNNLSERDGILSNLISGLAFDNISDEIKDVCFIIDDIERISSDSAMTDILGECLNLAENTNGNVSVIVLSCKEKIANKPMLEKCFSQIIPFSLPTKGKVEIVTGLTDRHKSIFDEELKLHLTSLLNYHNFNNIRVLNNTISKYIMLAEKLNEIDGTQYDLQLSKKHLLEIAVKVCFAHYIEDYSKTEIQNYLYSRSDALDETILSNLAHIFGRMHVDKEMLNYLLCDSLGISDMAIITSLPVIHDSLDLMLQSGYNNLNEVQYEDGLCKLKKIVNGEENATIDFLMWNRAINLYFELCKFEYITPVNETAIDDIRASLNRLEFEIVSDPDMVASQNYNNDFPSDLIESIEVKREEIQASSENNQEDEFKSRFIQSWRNVRDDVEASLDEFWSIIDAETICQAFDNWERQEIFDFDKSFYRRYLSEKTNSNNYICDLPILKSLLEKLTIKEFAEGRKKGTVKEFCHYISKAIVTLERAER